MTYTTTEKERTSQYIDHTNQQCLKYRRCQSRTQILNKSRKRILESPSLFGRLRHFANNESDNQLAMTYLIQFARAAFFACIMAVPGKSQQIEEIILPTGNISNFFEETAGVNGHLLWISPTNVSLTADDLQYLVSVLWDESDCAALLNYRHSVMHAQFQREGRSTVSEESLWLLYSHLTDTRYPPWHRDGERMVAKKAVYRWLSKEASLGPALKGDDRTTIRRERKERQESVPETPQQP